MKRVLGSVLIILVTISQIGTAEARNTLKITFQAPSEDGSSDSLYSKAVAVGSAEDSLMKKKMEKEAKSAKTKSKIISVCKSVNFFNGRIKITDARGGTAGLGNLSSVSVSNIKVERSLIDYPDYTEAETEALVEEYGEMEEWPEYEVDGYVYYIYRANCLFSGKVSVIDSNSYRLYVNGRAGPEYLKSEFAKMNWSITLVDAK